MSRPWFGLGKLSCAAALSVVALAGMASSAGAHTRMDAPKARDMQDGYKPTRSPGFVLPCGIARSAAQPVNTLTAGSTIGMKWTETVYHPGCFIIDFAKNDTGPTTVFDRLQIEPHAAGTMENKVYQVQVKLPAEPCTNCILRVRQYMVGSTPCPPATLKDTDANLYYSCANVVLTGGGGADASAPADGGGVDAVVDMSLPGSGGSTGSGGTSGASGGSSGSGGASASGGASGSGGSPATTGTGGSNGGGQSADSGSGCSVASEASGLASVVDAFGALGALGLMFLIRRRRRG